ncbi:MAG: 4Fe-4S binding protein [Candidatus Helarchaeota archaeon]
MEEFGNKIKYLPIHEDKCLLCRTCVGICPTSAIIIRKKKFKKS